MTANTVNESQQEQRLGLFSIRNRMFLFFLALVIVPAITLQFISTQTLQRSLEAEIDVELDLLTETYSLAFYELLESEISRFTFLGDDGNLEATINEINSAYPETRAEIDALLLARNEEWVNASSANIPLIRGVLNNDIVDEALSEFLENSEGYAEIMVTDRYGGLIAATNLTTNYYQADEVWWQAAWSNGQGATYIAPELTFDEHIGGEALLMSVPITSEGEFIGVLRAFYDLASIREVLGVFDFDEGFLALINAENEILAINKNLPVGLTLPTQFTAEGENDLITLQDGNGVSYLLEQEYIVGIEEAGEEESEHITGELGWSVVVIVPHDVAYSVVGEATNSTIVPVLLIISVGLISAFFVARRLTNPLRELTEAARRIGQDRDWDTRTTVQGNNEFGILGQAFNTMGAELKNVFSNLEDRIDARTADLATSAEIAAAANQIRDRDELISLTVNLIRDRFDFYYVQAYLIDNNNEFAVLTDGTGYAGRRLLAREHKLSLDSQSLVAKTIASGTATVVQDTINDPNWLPNELLPDTKSEIVIPLRAQNKIIGVLDIQHTVVDAFDDSQQQLFQTLADQLSITFENVNLLADTSERARRLATVAQVSIEASTERDIAKMLRTASQLTRNNFDLYHAHVYLTDENSNTLKLVAGAGEAGLEMVANKHSISLENNSSIVVQAVRTYEPVIVNDVTLSDTFLPNPLLPETHSEMAVPMVVGGRVVGVLDVQDSKVASFDEDDAQVLQILAAQLGVAVNNVQTLQLVETSARELDRIFNSTIDMLGAANFEGYFVQLNSAWEDNLGWTRDELMAEPFLNLVHPDDIEATMKEVEKAAGGMAVIGFTNRFRKRDGSYISISWKASTDFETQRMNFVARDVTEQLKNEADIRRRAFKMQAVTEISTEISGVTDVDELLWSVTNITAQKMGHYHVQVYLVEEGNQLVLHAGSGETGQKMVANNHAISMDAPKSLVARAAREREIVAINDVSKVEDHLANPLLPDTKAELAVPSVLMVVSYSVCWIFKTAV